MLILVTGFILQPVFLMAAPDLTGVWTSDNGDIQITQEGHKLTNLQTNPDLIKLVGKYQFEGEITGDVLKGKFASHLEDDLKAVCGKNWAGWTELELTISKEGSHLEGKWLRQTANVKARGCPTISSKWEPIVYTRS